MNFSYIMFFFYCRYLNRHGGGRSLLPYSKKICSTEWFTDFTVSRPVQKVKKSFFFLNAKNLWNQVQMFFLYNPSFGSIQYTAFRLYTLQNSFWQKEEDWIKELSLCHKLWIYNPNIFGTKWRKSMIFQTYII